MKSSFRCLLLFILLASISACNPILEMMRQLDDYQKFTISSDTLKRSGNEVVFTMSARFPRKLLPRRRRQRNATTYTFEIKYIIGDFTKPEDRFSSKRTEIDVGKFEFVGREYPNKEIAPAQTKEFRFPYKDQYKKGFLVYYSVVRIGDYFKRIRGAFLVTSNGKPVTGIIE